MLALPPALADAYFQNLAGSARAGERRLAQLLKGLLTLCYYELPPAQEVVGYRPGPYVAMVAQRRQARYAGDIRRAEAAVLALDTGEPAAARPSP
jgi:hypothetical protein